MCVSFEHADSCCGSSALLSKATFGEQATNAHVHRSLSTRGRQQRTHHYKSTHNNTHTHTSTHQHTTTQRQRTHTLIFNARQKMRDLHIDNYLLLHICTSMKMSWQRCHADCGNNRKKTQRVLTKLRKYPRPRTYKPIAVAALSRRCRETALARPEQTQQIQANANICLDQPNACVCVCGDRVLKHVQACVYVCLCVCMRMCACSFLCKCVLHANLCVRMSHTPTYLCVPAHVHKSEVLLSTHSARE